MELKSTASEDKKIEFIVSELKEKYGNKRLWVITHRRVKAVLTHSPKNAEKITFSQWAKINCGFVTPVTVDFIADVLEFSRQYDSKYTENIKPSHEPITSYQTSPAKLYCNF